jgi:cell division transport system permease protein
MSAWLRQHAHALAEALRRMTAQPVAAAFSIFVLALAIALPVLAAVALASIGSVTSALETEPHANVYLTLDATDEDARRVESALRSNPGAASVRFVSRTKALEELKSTTHLAEILATLDRNPLPHAFTVRLRDSDASRLAEARAQWSKLPKVDQVVADFEWSQRLARWVRLGDRVLAVIAIALAAAVAFIVGHLVRLQVVSQKEEIEVSQLIGATAADVRRPFLYHGLLQGRLAGLVALGLSFGAAAWLYGEMRALAPAYASELKVVFLSPSAVATVILAATAVGLMAAWWAVDRELRSFAAPRRNLQAD